MLPLFEISDIFCSFLPSALPRGKPPRQCWGEVETRHSITMISKEWDSDSLKGETKAKGYFLFALLKGEKRLAGSLFSPFCLQLKRGWGSAGGVPLLEEAAVIAFPAGLLQGSLSCTLWTRTLYSHAPGTETLRERPGHRHCPARFLTDTRLSSTWEILGALCKPEPFPFRNQCLVKQDHGLN